MTAPGRGPAPRHRLAARVVPLLALVLAGCGGGAAAAGTTTTTATTTARYNPWVPGVGGAITVGIDQAPTGCNPNTPSGATWADQLVLGAVLPSAFVVNPSGQSVYDQAVITSAELQSVSPQTVVYTINPKAVWSDGVPLTAADFIYAWQQQRGTTGLDTAATTAGYRDIQSVTSSNKGKTVTVVFKTPYADWQRLFADMLPAHVMEKAGWDPNCTSVDPAVDLSAGPFKIEKVVPGRQVVLVRNPKWAGGTVDLSRLTIATATSNGQLATWLRRGQAQVVLPSSYDPQFLASVGSLPDTDSTSDVSYSFLQLLFSTVGPATADERVRMAVAHAIDRQALVDATVGWADTAIVPAASHLYSQAENAYPSPTQQPPQLQYQPGSSPPTTSNAPTTAQPFPVTAELNQTDRLLISAGYFLDTNGVWASADGTPLVIRMAVDEGDGWAAVTAPLIQRQLAAAGIDVTLVSEPDLTSAGMAMVDGAADMALLPYQASPYPTQALAWFSPLLGPPGQGGSQDWSQLDDPTVNQTLTKAAQELNPVTAAPMYAQVDQTLWNEMVALPLFAEPMAEAWSRTTSGVVMNPTGPGLLWSPEDWAVLVPPTSTNTAAQTPTSTTS